MSMVSSTGQPNTSSDTFRKSVMNGLKSIRGSSSRSVVRSVKAPGISNRLTTLQEGVERIRIMEAWKERTRRGHRGTHTLGKEFATIDSANPSNNRAVRGDSSGS